MIPYAGKDDRRFASVAKRRPRQTKVRVKPKAKWRWGGAMASRADQLFRKGLSTTLIAKEMKIEEHEAEYLVNLGRAFRRKLPNPYRGQE